MASYTVVTNTTIDINLFDDIADQGWEISDNTAYHDGCNSGYIEKYFDLSKDTEWVFEFDILAIISGNIKIIVGDQHGTAYTTAGTKKEIFNITGNNVLVRFFSTGVNALELVKIYPKNVKSPGRTWVFNEDFNGWVGEHSYIPEFMTKLNGGFYCFKNGELWEQNINPIYNNFFGVQYTSKISFVANAEYQNNKLYFQVKIDSDGRWGIPEMTTQPNETWPNGMKSKLHANNFKLEGGKYWADIMRDMNDPRYASEPLKALFEGRVMEGSVLIVNMETNSTEEIKLKGVFIISADQERNI